MQQLNKHKVRLGWFHRYPARFSFDVLEHIYSGIASRLGRRPLNILDPFAGTGASLSFAKQIGIPSYGVELTELGTLICNVRLDPPEDLESACSCAEKLASNCKKGDLDRVCPELRRWIGDENSAQLDYLLSEIALINDSKLSNWLKLALSSALRPSSRWLSGSIKPQVDPNREFSDLKGHFTRVARMLKKDCETEASLFQHNCLSEVAIGDSRTLKFNDSSIDAIITSPPYGTMYDYVDVQRLSYLAFGWTRYNSSQIGRSNRIERDGIGFSPPSWMKQWYYEEFKAEDTIEGRALRDYFKGMESHFKEAYRVLKDGGTLAYAVANSIKRGRDFLLVEALAEILQTVGFCDIEIVRRNQSAKRILPAGRDIKTGRFSSSAKPMVDEFIIYAKKFGAESRL